MSSNETERSREPSRVCGSVGPIERASAAGPQGSPPPEGASEPREHTVTIEWDRHGCASYRFTCHAPADATCHSVYGADCACESWVDVGVEDGKPWHRPEGAEDDHRHVGWFDPAECNLRDWYENTDDALCGGSVTFPVEATWQGDYYTFAAVTR